MHRLLIIVFLVFMSAGFGWTESTSPAADSLNLKLNRSRHDQWFSQDKGHHFMVSAFLTGFSYYMCKQELDQSQQTACIASVSITFSIGAAKEIYDGVSGKGSPSFKDLLADAAGILVGFLLIDATSQ